MEAQKRAPEASLTYNSSLLAQLSLTNTSSQLRWRRRSLLGAAAESWRLFGWLIFPYLLPYRLWLYQKWPVQQNWSWLNKCRSQNTFSWDALRVSWPRLLLSQVVTCRSVRPPSDAQETLLASLAYSVFVAMVIFPIKSWVRVRRESGMFGTTTG